MNIKILVIFCFAIACVSAANITWAQPVPGCSRSADEVSRVETARSILKVNRNNYMDVINYWAEDAIYKETVVTNNSRQEMWEYLSAVFEKSPDMELIIDDELYKTLPDGSMTYMATNYWLGTWQGLGTYYHPGMSIIKFDPGEGCVSYQRDYFTEGDTWWGLQFFRPTIRQLRQVYIYSVGLIDRCFDEDGDGYGKYRTLGCGNWALDCNDYDSEVNPGAEEIPGNNKDDNCDNIVDPWWP